MFICEGLGAGLPYVGDSAVVKLIVPFKLMSSDFQSSGTPVFFEKVKYTFIIYFWYPWNNRREPGRRAQSVGYC